MVSVHLLDVYRATVEAAHMDDDMFEGLSLTSAVSERELRQEKQLSHTKVV
jgi:hypothetical protein